MLGRKTRGVAYFKYETLKGFALDFDVDPDGDYMKPGNSPPERAFQIARSAFDLLVGISERGVPSLDRKTQKRGGKWMVQNILFRGGQTSITQLAHALPALMARIDGALGDDEFPRLGAAEHVRFLKAVEDFYPLGKGPAEHMRTTFPAEFEVLTTHELRDDVKNGLVTGTRYEQALLKGEDPDTDPSLVAEQREWARDYYILQATLISVRQVLQLDWKKLVDKIVKTVDPNDAAMLPFRKRLVDAWAYGSRTYRQYAAIDSGTAG
jgi:hypothetical protein